ncbi:MAG TPA: SDR family oxidoreductase [Kribbella sp.]|uniref:SDR family NAD(P)-dependent oxidoreductase n=1 Tax=Kribbella sp. TaxID=1871183 RepID=UPI002D7837D4|nr:SDR family oxidoreductase [Kribbella sp.]HET6295382.1 SDR family oxidoreductase [Kribbella sp.]
MSVQTNESVDQQTGGKVALITGGSRGLGRSSALHLAAAGVDVILTYRATKDEADAVVAEIVKLGRSAVALQLDTGEVGSFDAFAEQVGGVLRDWGRSTFDYLHNNAGNSVAASFAETTEKDFDALVDVHFKGVFFLTQKLLPLLADGGAIVNVSSGLARFTTPGAAAYAAMKGAIEVLTRYQAKELGVRGIRVNTIAPGATATDFGGGLMRDNDQVRGYLATQVALGRVGEPDDIGAAVAALFSDDNRWLNAQRVEVSGGQSI